LVYPFSLASAVVGGALTLVGAGVCFRWYVFWRRHYRGDLLTEGPYAHVRHPFYTGFLALALGLTILIPIWETLLLAVFSVTGIVFFIEREEEYLLSHYGKSYRNYAKRVPWKLIPRIY
jgi:protein-S-isoprenylcysteine O-methyltransferase Ste14